MDKPPTKRRGPLLWLAGTKRRGRVAIVAVSLLYIASFGPACWITSRVAINPRWLFTAYAPFIWVLNGNGPDVLYDLTVWYSLAGTSSGWGWYTTITGEFVRFGPPPPGAFRWPNPP